MTSRCSAYSFHEIVNFPTKECMVIEIGSERANARELHKEFELLFMSALREKKHS